MKQIKLPLNPQNNQEIKINTFLFTQSLNCGENTKTEASLDIVNKILNAIYVSFCCCDDVMCLFSIQFHDSPPIHPFITFFCFLFIENSCSVQF